MKAKRIILSSILGVLLITVGSCSFISGGISGSKNYITRDFNVKDFDKINVSTVANICYSQSTDGTTSLSIYGSDNLVDLVDVEIKNKTLYMNMKKTNIKNGNVIISISSPNLYELNSSGIGNFSAEELLKTTTLKIINDGVGNIRINQMVCDDFEINSSGVGNATVEGKAENAILTCSGVGNINAANLEVENAKIESDGVGNISCYATNSIYARTNGVGNIRYKGNPTKKDLKKSGVGSIKQL